MPRTSWDQNFTEYHTYEDRCQRQWCRIHWTSVWYASGSEREKYPLAFNIKTSERGWVEAWVYCGPGAYLPKRS